MDVANLNQRGGPVGIYVSKGAFPHSLFGHAQKSSTGYGSRLALLLNKLQDTVSSL